MNRLLQVSNMLIISGLLIIGCSSSTSHAIEQLSDGTFTANIENQSSFDGDASFEITLPLSDRFPYAYEDSVLFLSLKTGEIRNTRELHGELVEYTIDIGLSLNALWQEDSAEFKLGSTIFSNIFIHPGTLESYDIKSGTIKVYEKNQELLSGDFDLVATNILGTEFDVSGKFRAILSE